MVQCMASVCILAALTITTSHCPQWRIKIWAHNIHKTAAMVRTYNQTSKALLIMARNFNLTPWILKWSWHSNGNGGSGLLLHSCSRCPLLAIFSSYLLFGDSQFAKFASSWRPGSPVNSSQLWRHLVTPETGKKRSWGGHESGPRNVSCSEHRVWCPRRETWTRGAKFCNFILHCKYQISTQR